MESRAAILNSPWVERKTERGSKWTVNPFIIEEIILFLSILGRGRRTTSIIPVFSPLSGCQSTLWSFEGMRRESREGRAVYFPH